MSPSPGGVSLVSSYTGGTTLRGVCLFDSLGGYGHHLEANHVRWCFSERHPHALQNFFIAFLAGVRRIATNYAVAILGAVGVKHKESKRSPTGRGPVQGRSNMGELEIVDVLDRPVVKGCNRTHRSMMWGLHALDVCCIFRPQETRTVIALWVANIIL